MHRAARDRVLGGAALGVALFVGACASRFEVERPDAGDSGPKPSASVSGSASTPSPPDASAPLGDAGPDVAPDRDAAPPLEAGEAGDAAEAGPLAKRVFFTATAYRGSDISGLGGAPGVLGGDALCKQAATAAGLVGTFRAWLSDDTQSAALRVTGPGPFYDVSRTKLVFEKNPTMSLPLVAIPDQNGAVSFSRSAWTGSTSAGVKLNDCDRWSPSGSMGTGGNASTPSNWSNLQPYSCDTARRLYCFEQ